MWRPCTTMKSHSFILSIGILAFAPFHVSAQKTEPSADERMRALEARIAELEGVDVELISLKSNLRNGPVWLSDDGSDAFTLVGRTLYDVAFFWPDQAVEDALMEPEDGTEGGPIQNGDTFDNGSELRRARIYFRGKMESVVFKLDYDFAGGDARPRDVFVGLLDPLPLVDAVRVGHQREPFSLMQGSSRYHVFMEKGVQSAFSPGRNSGVRVMSGLGNKRVRWSAGAFYDWDNTGSRVDEDAYNFTARVTGTPIFDKDNKRLIHIGGAYNYRHLGEAGIRFRRRPESHLAPRLVDTGDLAANDANIIGTEAALVLGPFSLMGEYMVADVDTTEVPDPTFDGYFVQASYFLTGESRPYSKPRGSFHRVQPHRNFRGKEGGIGAWEIAARYSAIDLEETEIPVGEMDVITVGLNWYLNPNTKVMTNYILADLDGVGDTHIAQMRFQVEL